MAFFKNVISAFSNAVKAGQDFNPQFEEVIKELDELHEAGQLDGVIYKAEIAYQVEHDAYKAKGIHTDAMDSQNDSRALAHFLDALENGIDTLSPSAQESVKKLLDLRNQMEHILGNIIKNK